MHCACRPPGAPDRDWSPYPGLSILSTRAVTAFLFPPCMQDTLMEGHALHLLLAFSFFPVTILCFLFSTLTRETGGRNHPQHAGTRWRPRSLFTRTSALAERGLTSISKTRSLMTCSL